MKDKIIAVHLLNNRSGSPKIFGQALAALAKRGTSIELYTSRGPGFLDDSDGRYHQVPYRWSANRWLRLLFYVYSQMYLFIALLQYWRQPVTIYINTLLPFGAAMAGWLMRKRVVYHLHETHVEPALLNSFLKFWVKVAADERIYVSDYLKRVLPFPGKTSQVIPNAIADGFGVDTALIYPSGPFEVLMVASLKKEKGLWEFVKLAESLPEMHFTLVVGAAPDQVADFFCDRSMPNNLRLLPSQEDVKPLYAQANLLLNLSDPELLPETFGMTVLEGMAYGLPVIVPPVGGPADLVAEGVEGFWVDGRDHDLLISRVMSLASNPETWLQFSRSAREKSQQYRMQHFAQAVIAGVLPGLGGDVSDNKGRVEVGKAV